MWQLLIDVGGIAGLLSLALALFLEWPRIRSRWNDLEFTTTGAWSWIERRWTEFREGWSKEWQDPIGPRDVLMCFLGWCLSLVLLGRIFVNLSYFHTGWEDPFLLVGALAGPFIIGRYRMKSWSAGIGPAVAGWLRLVLLVLLASRSC